VIPTLAPYLLPLILGPLKKAYPGLAIELWEDQTRQLVEGLRSHRLDAALLASSLGTHEISEVALFAEPLMAVLPAGHRLAAQKAVNEEDLAADLLVMADGHCLVNQSLAACGAKAGIQSAMQAATLETLVNLVVAGYGTTLVPALAASGFSGRGAELRPLRQGATRMIRLVSRPGFPRPQALRAIEKVVRRSVPAEWRQ
jgi:LysR family hydrogen peroxide-inducible transcriptional activator